MPIAILINFITLQSDKPFYAVRKDCESDVDSRELFEEIEQYLYEWNKSNRISRVCYEDKEFKTLIDLPKGDFTLLNKQVISVFCEVS